jgi:hypothetical protein
MPRGRSVAPRAASASNSTSSIRMISRDSLLTIVLVRRSQSTGTVTRPV